MTPPTTSADALPQTAIDRIGSDDMSISIGSEAPFVKQDQGGYDDADANTRAIRQDTSWHHLPDSAPHSNGHGDQHGHPEQLTHIDTVYVMFHPAWFRMVIDDGSDLVKTWKDEAQTVYTQSYRHIPHLRTKVNILFTLAALGLLCLVTSSLTLVPSLRVEVTSSRGQSYECFRTDFSPWEGRLTLIGTVIHLTTMAWGIYLLYQYRIFKLFLIYLWFFTRRNVTLILSFAIASLVGVATEGVDRSIRLFLLGVVITPAGAMLLDHVFLYPQLYDDGKATDIWIRVTVFIWLANYVLRMTFTAILGKECGSSTAYDTMTQFILKSISETMWITGQIKMVTLLLRKVLRPQRPLLFFSYDEQYKNFYRMTFLPKVDPTCAVFGTHDETKVYDLAHAQTHNEQQHGSIVRPDHAILPAGYTSWGTVVYNPAWIISGPDNGNKVMEPYLDTAVNAVYFPIATDRRAKVATTLVGIALFGALFPLLALVAAIEFRINPSIDTRGPFVLSNAHNYVYTLISVDLTALSSIDFNTVVFCIEMVRPGYHVILNWASVASGLLGGIAILFTLGSLYSLSLAWTHYRFWMRSNMFIVIIVSLGALSGFWRNVQEGLYLLISGVIVYPAVLALYDTLLLLPYVGSGKRKWVQWSFRLFFFVYFIAAVEGYMYGKIVNSRCDTPQPHSIWSSMLLGISQTLWVVGNVKYVTILVWKFRRFDLPTLFFNGEATYNFKVREQVESIVAYRKKNGLDTVNLGKLDAGGNSCNNRASSMEMGSLGPDGCSHGVSGNTQVASRRPGGLGDDDAHNDDDDHAKFDSRDGHDTVDANLDHTADGSVAVIDIQPDTHEKQNMFTDGDLPLTVDSDNVESVHL